MEWKSLDGYELIVTDELKQLVLANYNGRLPPAIKYYRIVCPRCYERNRLKGEYDYAHTNLSVAKDFSFGKCFRCNAVFTDKYYGAASEYDSKLLDLKDTHFEIESINTDHLENYHDLSIDTDAIKYIQNIRGNIYYNIHDNFASLKYSNNKLVIPYFNTDGNTFYYQYRYVDVSKSPTRSKYYNPPINNKPIYITPNLDGKILWNPMNPTILVEGAITAIACKQVVGNDVNVIGLMGKVITNYQLQFIKYLGIIDLYVMLDEYSLSDELSKTLSLNGLKNSIIPTDGKDAEELLIELGPDRYYTILDQYISKSSIKESLEYLDSFNNDTKITPDSNLLSSNFKIRLTI